MNSRQLRRQIITGGDPLADHSDNPTRTVSPQVPLNLAAQPCFALQSASHAITRAYKPLLDPLGLTYTQYTVMLALWEADGISLAELAEKLHTNPPSLTPVIRRLAERELLTRQRVPDDERRLTIQLTKSGEQLRDQARDIPQAMLCRVRIATEEAGELIEVLSRIRQSLDAR